MVFDNDEEIDGKKRLYVMGMPRSRERALGMVKEAVDFRLSKDKKPESSEGSDRRASRRSRSRSR